MGTAAVGYGVLAAGLRLKVPEAAKPIVVPTAATPATIRARGHLCSRCNYRAGGDLARGTQESTDATWINCEAPVAGVAPGIIEPVIWAW